VLRAALPRAALAGALLADGAHAHVVYDRATLRQYAQHSAVSLVAEFVSGPLLWVAPDASDRQEYFRVRSVEVLRGDAPPELFEFFPHAEGFPSFRAGDRAIVFLERTAERPEFAPLAGRFPWFSVQEEGEEWKLSGDEGEAALALARGYADLADAEPAEGLRRLRALVARGLGSPFAPLRADARSELIALRGARGFFGSDGDVAPFAALVSSPAIPFAERVSLARLLEGAPGFDAARTFGTLVARAKSREDTLALVRVFATSPDPAVARFVVARLADPDPRVRREAALALGRARRAGDVPALARAAADPDEGVARAALGSLGAIGDPAAREALRAVRSGGDARRAGFAAAELRRLEQRDRAEATGKVDSSHDAARSPMSEDVPPAP
jgi:hypothetical protein